MVDRSMPALLRNLKNRVTSLERRLARIPRIPDPPDLSRLDAVGHGTSAQRDAFFGVPTTNAERVALANREPVWFNTDFGWEESYYADSALAGLTTLGLVAGTASAWYPTGEGPASVHYASGAQNVSPGVFVTSWSAWGTGGSSRRGGAGWFTYDAATGKVACVKAGRYEAEGMVTQQAGAGTTVVHLMRDNNPVFARANPLDSGQAQAAVMRQPQLAMNAGQTLSLFNGVGTYQLNMVTGNSEVRGFLAVRYKSPLLATE